MIWQKKILGLGVFLGFVLLLLIFSNWYATGQIKDKISNNLTGKNVTYYDLAGKSRTYTIVAEDIQTITKTKLYGQSVWKVLIGKSPLQWNFYFDSKGEKIIKEEQLFKT